MANPDNGSLSRRMVDDHQDPIDAAVTPGAELTAEQVAAFATLVAEENRPIIQRTLAGMTAEQVRTLAVALARQLNGTENADGAVRDVGPNAICAMAISTAVLSFGTTRDAVLGADRHRAVSDARAVAMTAARRGGLTLPSIASYFGKNHTSVIYAQSKVANNPRLNAVCVRIVDELDAHYADPISVRMSTHRGNERSTNAVSAGPANTPQTGPPPPRRRQPMVRVSDGPAR